MQILPIRVRNALYAGWRKPVRSVQSAGAALECGNSQRLMMRAVPGIDRILDARHRQRRFRHVSRQHDTASAVRLESAVLFAVRQACIQRQHFGMP